MGCPWSSSLTSPTHTLFSPTPHIPRLSRPKFPYDAPWQRRHFFCVWISPAVLHGCPPQSVGRGGGRGLKRTKIGSDRIGSNRSGTSAPLHSIPSFPHLLLRCSFYIATFS